MSMHPKHDLFGYEVLWDLLFSEDRAGALEQLNLSGLIESSQRDRWNQFLSPLIPGSRAWQNSVNHFHLKTCDEIEKSSYLSTKSPLEITRNLRTAAASFGVNLNDIAQLRGHVFLDYGSGVYRPFNAAMILYCNGVDQVYAYEPLPLKTEFVYQSYYHMIQLMSSQPDDYIFSGIDKSEFMSRLKTFLVDSLREKIQYLNATPDSQMKFGGVTFFRAIEQMPANSVDYHFSNAVLEHVEDINKYMTELRRVTRATSLGFHIVDFLDHRYYDDKNVSPMEKYFDGTLQEINGLTPSSLEQKICEAGWALQKIQALRIPERYVTEDPRPRVTQYSHQSLDELTEHINFYKFVQPA